MDLRRPAAFITNDDGVITEAALGERFVNYKAWQDDPAAMLTFMQTNVIVTATLADSEVVNVPEYLFVTRTDRRVEKDGKIVGHMYMMHNTPPGSTTGIKSFICGYKLGEMHCVILTSDADFCFTRTMNGCTFGIGSPTSCGDVLVSHANSPKGENEQLKSTQSLFNNGGGTTGILEPSLYRMGGGSLGNSRETGLTINGMNTATTFGIRDRKTNKWKFYFQSYRASQTLLYAGVLPVLTNSKGK
jgi:hypothetical protein